MIITGMQRYRPGEAAVVVVAVSVLGVAVLVALLAVVVTVDIG